MKYSETLLTLGKHYVVTIIEINFFLKEVGGGVGGQKERERKNAKQAPHLAQSLMRALVHDPEIMT